MENETIQNFRFKFLKLIFNIQQRKNKVNLIIKFKKDKIENGTRQKIFKGAKNF